MSEEIKSNGMEINEAAPENAAARENTPPQLSDAELANVSGAMSRDEARDIEHWAEGICDDCMRRAYQHCDGGSYGALAAYLKANGKYSISGYKQCPYYRP